MNFTSQDAETGMGVKKNVRHNNLIMGTSRVEGFFTAFY